MSGWRMDENRNAASWGGDDAASLSHGIADAAVAAVGQAIGLQLRAVYSEAVRNPLPERFQALLEKLDNV